MVSHRCSILCNRRLIKEHNGTNDILVSRLVHGEGGKMERKNYQRHWPAAVVKKSHRSYVCKICNNIKQHTEPSTAYHMLLVHAHDGAQGLGRKGRKWCHALIRCKGNLTGTTYIKHCPPGTHRWGERHFASSEYHSQENNMRRAIKMVDFRCDGRCEVALFTQSDEASF